MKWSINFALKIVGSAYKLRASVDQCRLYSKHHGCCSRNNFFLIRFYASVVQISFLIAELLSSWESLLHWSENASVARQLQEEMSVLKSVLNKLGYRDGILDSESSIQMSIDDLKVSQISFIVNSFTFIKISVLYNETIFRYHNFATFCYFRGRK